MTDTKQPLFSSAPRIFARLLFIGIHLFGSRLSGQTSEIEAANIKYIISLRSIHCAINVEGKENDLFNKIGEVDYGITQDKIYLDDIEKDSYGKITWSQRYTWNGKQACDFFRQDNMHLATYDYRVASPVMEGLNVLLDPYAFLLGDRNTRSGSCLMCDEIANSAQWDILTNSSSSLKHAKLNDRDCIVADVEGGKLPRLSNVSYHVRVWFDVAHGFYPIQWQRLSKEDTVLDQYTVTNLGFIDNNPALPYPQTSEFLMNDSKGQLYNTRRITIKRLENNAKIEAEAFRINPALANTIWDDATHTRIEVRHDPSQ